MLTYLQMIKLYLNKFCVRCFCSIMLLRIFDVGTYMFFGVVLYIYTVPQGSDVVLPHQCCLYCLIVWDLVRIYVMYSSLVWVGWGCYGWWW
jgi:hypothetical protein